LAAASLHVFQALQSPPQLLLLLELLPTLLLSE
jgi:hypothetical protein